MRFQESLIWILDKPDSSIHDQDENIQESIAFVHSLGLKCDSVGWCSLNLADPRIPEIFEKITAFCREKGWKARCAYRREYTQVESDWYELRYNFFKNSTFAGRLETDTPGVQVSGIRAFYETGSGLKRWGMDLFAPERLRKSCLENGWELDFCWARDVGRYEAEQYFHTYGRQRIPRIAVDFDLEKSPGRLRAAGGWLPEIAKVFHTLQFVTLPDCYPASDMPQGGIGYAYVMQTFSCAGRNTLLVHKDVVRVLLQEKVIPESALAPAPVVDALPGGYIWQETQPIPRPSQAFMEKMDAQYQALKEKPRPVRTVSEKEAVKLLRAAKKERKKDFQKAMPKADAQALSDSLYAPVASYYLVANGGQLSDEYRLLPHDQAVAETETFFQALEMEGLLEKKPQGAVIASCADGDTILLCPNGTALRFSHEVPEATAQWPSLAQFVAEAIQE